MTGPGAPFVFESRVRFVDTDGSGRIHYTAWFRHTEAAEQEFLRALGHPYGDVRKGEFAYPRVHVDADYLSGVGCDDLLRIEVWVDRVGATSYTLAFAATVDSRPAARAKIVVVCMDRDTGKAHALPEDLAALLRPHLRSAS